eukprot:365702-Chlamydomonas_euryale.AAC.31
MARMQGVEHAIHWARPGSTIRNVDTLGHCEIVRTLPDGKHLKSATDWHLQEPGGYEGKNCGVDLLMPARPAEHLATVRPRCSSGM